MKTVLFINQSPNSMLYDIAEIYSANGYKCILLSGTPAVRSDVFNENAILQPYNRSSTFSRLGSWLKFLFLAVKWIKKNRNPIDLYFLVSNPPFVLYLPLLTSVKKARIRMLVYDLYPDIFVRMNRSFLTFLPGVTMATLNRRSFRYAEYIYAPSASLGYAIGRYTEKPVSVVYNWVDSTAVQPVLKSKNLFLIKHGLGDKFIVLYSGNLGKTHDAETLLAVADELVGQENIVFVFIGEGEGMNIVEEHIKTGAANCVRYPFQDDLFLHSIACGDVAWLSYKKGYEEYSIPSKLPFFLATGTPVVMVGDPDSELGTIISENKIGYAIANHEAKAIASVILNMMSTDNVEMKNRCIDYSRKHFSKRNAEAFL